MSLQYSAAVLNGKLDAIEVAAGTAVLCRLYTGAPPANCATAATGTKLVEMSLPSDWMSAASAGVKAKLGTWSAAAVAAGTAGYFRIYDTAGTNCHIQGTVAQGAGDMSLDNTSIAVSQVVTVNTFSITSANA